MANPRPLVPQARCRRCPALGPSSAFGPTTVGPERVPVHVQSPGRRCRCKHLDSPVGARRTTASCPRSPLRASETTVPATTLSSSQAAIHPTGCPDRSDGRVHRYAAANGPAAVGRGNRKDARYTARSEGDRRAGLALASPGRRVSQHAGRDGTEHQSGCATQSARPNRSALDRSTWAIDQFLTGRHSARSAGKARRHQNRRSGQRGAAPNTELVSNV